MNKGTAVFHYGDVLTPSVAWALAQGRVRGLITETTRQAIRKSADRVAQIVASGRVVYGINTGFGPLCTTGISREDASFLQENILKSHAVGVGAPIEKEIAKLMLILKVQALSKGYSGVREATIDRIIWHIEEDIIPVVPAQGSVGASGDLAPLSHLFLPLIGYGKVRDTQGVRATREVLRERGLAPIVLSAKEGLALINGTQFIAAHAVKAVAVFHRVLMQGDIIAALMLEGLQGSVQPFYPELHRLRAYPGNQMVATTLYHLLKDSDIVAAHADCGRVQDPYSLRCIPQVHGASRTAWQHLKELVSIEINAVTDNPVLIADDLTISGGNFHGQPVALVLDYACLAASEMGNIADRRVYLSLEGTAPGVPKLLLKATGLHSGFMILQYTTAALASENKSLCFPASADSIPTSLGQEDLVSMGSISGRKLLQVLDNVEKIQSIELLCAAQALDFHLPLRSTPVVAAVYDRIRAEIPHIEADREMTDLLERALRLVQEGTLLRVARRAAEQSGQPYIDPEFSSFDTY